MIILDTNVVSEPLKIKPDERVIDWLNQQSVGSLYFTAISLDELLLGVALLPSGKRKTRLGSNVSQAVAAFETRILSFDRDAAQRCSAIRARNSANGITIPLADAQIAAIADHRGFTVATRDVRPFLAAGVLVMNPWSS